MKLFSFFKRKKKRTAIDAFHDYNQWLVKKHLQQAMVKFHNQIEAIKLLQQNK